MALVFDRPQDALSRSLKSTLSAGRRASQRNRPATPPSTPPSDPTRWTSTTRSVYEQIYVAPADVLC